MARVLLLLIPNRRTGTTPGRNLSVRFEMKDVVNCPKCHGYMYTERFADFALTFFAWKCINCGTVMDGDIIENKSGLHANHMNMVEVG